MAAGLAAIAPSDHSKLPRSAESGSGKQHNIAASRGASLVTLRICKPLRVTLDARATETQRVTSKGAQSAAALLPCNSAERM